MGSKWTSLATLEKRNPGPSLSPWSVSGADALQCKSSHPVHYFPGDKLLVLFCAATDLFLAFFPFLHKHSHFSNISLYLPVFLYRNEEKCAFCVISDQQSVVPGHGASPTHYILPAVAFPGSGLLHKNTIHCPIQPIPFMSSSLKLQLSLWPKPSGQKELSGPHRDLSTWCSPACNDLSRASSPSELRAFSEPWHGANTQVQPHNWLLLRLPGLRRPHFSCDHQEHLLTGEPTVPSYAQQLNVDLWNQSNSPNHSLSHMHPEQC